MHDAAKVAELERQLERSIQLQEALIAGLVSAGVLTRDQIAEMMTGILPMPAPTAAHGLDQLWAQFRSAYLH
ncbi:hypothetical protein [Rhizorhabdus argentea]|uniref:hypothetical protein n=1 Tax=Rhizorhabdus argentea TaxID=1387174 RepID=UPI0030EC574B